MIKYSYTSCQDNGLYQIGTISSLITKLEKILKVRASKQRFLNMTNEELENAAEMFIYLGTCQYSGVQSWFKSWFTFYKNLFQNYSVDKILLTLNRMLKIDTSSFEARIRAGKLLKRATDLLPLRYREIRTLTKKQQEDKVSAINRSSSRGSLSLEGMSA